MSRVFRISVPGQTQFRRPPKLASPLQRAPFKFAFLGQLVGKGSLERKIMKSSHFLHFGLFSMAIAMKTPGALGRAWPTAIEFLTSLDCQCRFHDYSDGKGEINCTRKCVLFCAAFSYEHTMEK